VVNDNTDTPCLLLADPSFLEFGKCESSTLTDLPVVADSLCTDGRTKEGEGANAKGGSFGFARCATAEFATWLVKPGADSALPVFTKMVRVKD
jgi:hypothetical protein